MTSVRSLRQPARADDVRARAEAAASAGSAASALALIKAAAEDVERNDPLEAAVLLAEAAWYARMAHGSARALELARQAERLAAGAGGGVALLVGARLGDALQWDGRYSEARHEWLKAAALPTPPAPELLCARANALLRAGELSGAQETAYAAAARARSAEARPWLRDALTFQAIAEIHLGLLREADSSARELEAVAGPALSGDRLEAIGIRAWVDALTGDEQSCRARIALAHEAAAPLGLTASSGMAAGLLALSLGEHEQAADQLETKLSGMSPLAALLSLRPFLDGLVEACVRAGRDERAAELLAAVVEPAVQTEQPRYVALAHRLRALVSGDLAGFEDALEQHRLWGNRFEEARTRLLYGEALRRAKRRKDAREHLSAAASAFAAVGAAIWQRRARDELRAAGARIPRPATGVPLTAQEERIVRLVAEGLSNKEIAGRLVLSTKTVEGHLRNVFEKLGVSSRTQVARALNRRP